MARITITYPSAWTPQVVDALCADNNYQATIDGQPNPESRDAFALRMVKGYVTGGVKRGNREVKTDAAGAAADVDDAAIETDFVVGFTA